MSVRILVADDHTIFREGLKSLIEETPEFKVVGEAKTGREAVQFYLDLKPDLVIMDIGMPELNGVEASKQILRDAPDAKIIILSMHRDRRFVIETFQTGVKGYILKETAYEDLSSAIKKVYKGGIYLSSEFMGKVVNHVMHKVSTGRSESYYKLTSKEREVLQLIAEGRSTKEISHIMDVSSKTVDTHRKNIMNKLNIHSLQGLTKFAIAEGMTSIDSV